MLRLAVIGAVALGAVLLAVFSGWDALIVYAFFVGIAGALAYGAAVGGGWIRGASRSRFDRDR